MKRAVATVIATRRSAPRPIGSKLLVTEEGSMQGSVSGGCVESEVYEACRGVLRGDAPQLLTFGISDEQAFSVGLPCGGEIDVFVQEYDAELFERIGERRAVVYTDLSSGEQRLAFEGDDEQTDSLLRDARSQVTGNVFANLFGPPPRLLVFGAIDTAEALCAAAKRLGWRTMAADARGRFATPERLPS
ncbi:MAG TPA: XdhC family protein, partial [Gaiellaceae bacterium]|nr:XdhC family protein [Gaiellaceae bacterium]